MFSHTIKPMLYQLRMINHMQGFPQGFRHYPFYFDIHTQQILIKAVREGVAKAPFFQPTMPRTNRPMSVVLSNFGPLGWVADQRGYRYESSHPRTGQNWPPIPSLLLQLWQDMACYPVPPQACLINWYRKNARMGLHVDKDEIARHAPVISISLGDPALFKIGGLNRRDRTRSLKLFSGDVVVMAGQARHCYHGVSKVFYGESTLVAHGGRINLTLRCVNAS